MNRALLAAVACMVALCGFLGWRVHTLTGSNAVLRGANTALLHEVEQQHELRAAEQKIAEQYASQIKLLKEQHRRTNATLDKAVRENAPWSDQRVPSSVVDALGL